jgi:gas vesicle protein
VQLRQVSVRMGGRNEKLIIITDESAKIHFEQIKHKGQHMQKFTEQMITQIDLYAGQASETIKEVYSHVSAEGLKFTETC